MSSMQLTFMLLMLEKGCITIERSAELRQHIVQIPGTHTWTPAGASEQ